MARAPSGFCGLPGSAFADIITLPVNAGVARGFNLGIDFRGDPAAMAAVVPGLLSCLVVPWITYRVLKPDKTKPHVAQPRELVETV